MLLVFDCKLSDLWMTDLPLLATFEVRFSDKCASTCVDSFLPASADCSFGSSLGLLLLEEHLLAHPIHHQFYVFQCEAVLQYLLLLLIFYLRDQLLTTFLSTVFLCYSGACRIGDLQRK